MYVYVLCVSLRHEAIRALITLLGFVSPEMNLVIFLTQRLVFAFFHHSAWSKHREQTMRPRALSVFRLELSEFTHETVSSETVVVVDHQSVCKYLDDQAMMANISQVLASQM